MTFKQFDFVVIKTRDGAEFKGVITEITDLYVCLNGYGFPHAQIAPNGMDYA